MGDHCYRGTGSSVLCHFISYFVFCKSSPHALHLISNNLCVSFSPQVGFFKRKGKQRKEELNAQMLEEQQGGDTPFDGPVES